MSPLTASAPLPNPESLPDGYSRHRSEVEAQRVVLHELTSTRDWGGRSWAELVEELVGLGRTDVPLARLAEGHADAMRILAQADRKPQRGVLYGVWASGSQHSGVRAERADDGTLTLDGPLAFASGAGLLDRALVPVWLDADTHLLADVDLAEVPVDTTRWRTAAMAASRTHQVSLAGRRIGPDDVVGGDNFYLQRPGFFASGIGVAACWVGGAARVVDLLLRRHEHVTTAQQLRLGRIRAELAGAAYAVRSGARWLDESDLDAPGLDLAAVAGETRSVVAGAARRLLEEAKVVTGPAGLALDEDMGHAVADLELYLGQHNPDNDALLLGDPSRRP